MSLDPESLLGIKSAVLKAAVAGTMLGVLWRREFKLAEALSSIATGLGSATRIAPAALAHSGITHEDVSGETCTVDTAKKIGVNIGGVDVKPAPCQ
jgi:hypothetical protein